MRFLVSGVLAAWTALLLAACSHHSPSPMQICSASSLAEERQSTMNAVNGAERQAQQTGQTVLSQKLQSYSARFEIAHRSMVSSCQLYANCLDSNGGQETKCLRSESRMSAAQSEYYSMLRELDRLTAQVNIRTGQTRNPQPPAPTPATKCDPNCATVQNVFTTDCCPLPSS